MRPPPLVTREEGAPEESAPLVARGGKDAEILKSAKAWRKVGRRVPQGCRPIRTEVDERGTTTRLFAASQTISEESWRAELRQAWKERWLTLMAALDSWRERLSALDGPEAENALMKLLEEREELVDRWQDMASRAGGVAELELFPTLEEETWREAVRLFREHRFGLILVEAGLAESSWAEGEGTGTTETLASAPVDPVVLRLAETVDRAMIRQEERADPYHLVTYWQYFGRFMKALDAARFEREVADVTQIRHFHTLFRAREQRRQFHLFLGPTNSGKTYQALQKLAQAESGTYLAPLRLLALEVADTLNSWGVPCHMVTGEERLEVPGARHTASTIEMLALGHRHQVSVIDEAQMLGDPDRGWAWTQAILGVQADEVCVVGAPEALPAVEKLLALTGDPYTVTTLERLAPLEPLERSVRHFHQLEPGTAIICFSRSGVLTLKESLERETGQRVAVLYGALPPEVRRDQAYLFASGEAPFLVATDAIGMGLNLPIRTLLFAQDSKSIDRREHPLTPLEVRQIAGRAGRYGKNEIGFVGTFRIPVTRIREALEATPDSVRRAPLAPNLDHLLAIAALRERKKPALAHLLDLFVKTVKPDPRIYRIADLEEQTILARITDRHPKLDLGTRFALSAAPVSLRVLPVVRAYERMVVAVATEAALKLDSLLPSPPEEANWPLEWLETAMRIVNLYSWLHYRFPAIFPDLEAAEANRREINRRINRQLRQKPQGDRRCETCGEPLTEGHAFRLCDPCWERNRRGRRHWVRGGRESSREAPFSTPPPSRQAVSVETTGGEAASPGGRRRQWGSGENKTGGGRRFRGKTASAQRRGQSASPRPRREQPPEDVSGPVWPPPRTK
ncbi:MAG: hypothetical protein HQL59_00360 [Magnetococcales bacterium]|nr:hypothetical protein [Magnetococcales bacterium]